METEGMMINGSSKSSSEDDKRFEVVIHVEQWITRSRFINIRKLSTEIAHYSGAFNFLFLADACSQYGTLNIVSGHLSHCKLLFIFRHLREQWTMNEEQNKAQ